MSQRFVLKVLLSFVWVALFNLLGLTNAYSLTAKATDCNSNGILDLNEIRRGLIPDINLNNTPDDCETSRFILWDLGSLSSQTLDTPTSINSIGQAVGVFGNLQAKSFFYDASVRREIEVLPELVNNLNPTVKAYSISNQSLVVGISYSSGISARPIYWTPTDGTRLLFNNPDPGVSWNVRSNSSAGIVGYRGTQSNRTAFFISVPGTNPVDLYSIPGWNPRAMAITESGLIVGSRDGVSGEPNPSCVNHAIGTRPVVWNAQSPNVAPRQYQPFSACDPYADPSDSPRSINDHGDFVGRASSSSSGPSPRMTAAWLDNGNQVIFATWLGGNGFGRYECSGEGRSINNNRQVVGHILLPAPNASDCFHDKVQRAFIWEPSSPQATTGTMLDLSNLITPGSAWVLETARVITDQELIVGSGLLNGVPRGFILTPN